MKDPQKAILVIACLLILGAERSQGRQLVITWRYHNAIQGSWVAVGINRYGGYDYSCTGVYLGCGLYDWKSVYYYNVQPPSLLPGATSPAYPDNPRAAFMQSQGQAPPSSLPEPTVTQTDED